MPKKRPRPIRVAYDILRMTAGGANGGIKTHHYEFLRHFSEHHQKDLQLLVFCQSEVVEELKFLSANPLNQIHVHGTRSDFEFRDSDGRNPPLHFWPELPEDLLRKLGVEVLYAGFGDSDLHEAEIPQISLLVDVLHKDMPEMLPQEEVERRDVIFRRAIDQADLIQTNSKFCIESLKKHYRIPDEKLFHIYLPLHGRFNRVEMGPLPEQLRGLEHKYFLYPANYWPHKNHKRLIEAYALYQKEEEDPVHLALTGSPSPKEKELRSLSRKKGVAHLVHFLGHLCLSDLKSTYEHSKAIIFPSLYEGFGLPALEATYFQKPIACSNTASLPEIASAPYSGFDPTKIEDIARTLSSINFYPTLLQSGHRLENIQTDAKLLENKFIEAATLIRNRTGDATVASEIQAMSLS